MREKVAILVGDKSRKFSKVDFLRTKKVGGGNCYWAPMSARQTTTKYISENGTYKASDEKDSNNKAYYGFSEVNVNVPNADKAIGKEPDGNTHVIEPDINGDLTDHIIPDYIRITSQPYKTSYSDGETISMSGMVVKAYQGDGSIWEASGYSSGIIPHSELTLTPAVASGGGGQKIEYSTPDGFDVDNIHINGKIYSEDRVGCAQYIGGTNPTPAEREEYQRLAEIAKIGYNENNKMISVHGGATVRNYFIKIIRCATIRLGSGYIYNIVASQSEGKLGAIRSDGGGESSVHAPSYTYDNKTVYYTTFTNVNSAYYSDIKYSDINEPFSSNQTKAVAWAMLYGSEISKGAENIVTVSWHRPDDGKELADTFNITVAP